MNKLTKNVIEQIKNKNIKPVPKWEFMLKEYFINGLFVVNLIVGSIGFAITLYILTNNEEVIDGLPNTDIIQWLIFSVPFVWILITIFFIVTAYYNFKHTIEGYKFSVARILLVNIFITFLIGIALTFTGTSEKLNNVFTTNIPYYNNIFDLRGQMWMRPNEGYLAGSITSTDNINDNIIIRDLNGKEWVVDINDAIIKGRVVIQENEKIKIIGKLTNPSDFHAIEIRPWSGNMR